MFSKLLNWFKKFYTEGNCTGGCCQGRKPCDCKSNSVYDDSHLDGRNH